MTMTANPDSALRQALVAAEKALAPFKALLAICEAAHRRMSDAPAKDDDSAHFNISIGTLRRAAEAHDKLAALEVPR